MLGMKYKVLQGKCCSSWDPLPWLKGKRGCVGIFFVSGLLVFCIRLFWGGGGACNLAPPCIYFFLLLFFTSLSLLSEANSIAGLAGQKLLQALLLQPHIQCRKQKVS